MRKYKNITDIFSLVRELILAGKMFVLVGIVLLSLFANVTLALAASPANNASGLVFSANECYYKAVGSKEIVVRGSLYNTSETQYVYAIKAVKITVCNIDGKPVAAGVLKPQDIKLKKLMPGQSCSVVLTVKGKTGKARLATFPDRPKVQSVFMGYKSAPAAKKIGNSCT